MSRNILKKNKIIIVPNSELVEFENEIKIVSADKSFYREFKDYNMQLVRLNLKEI